MENREFLEFQDIKFFWHPYFKYYLASKCGKILSLKWNKKRILKLYTTRYGYLDFNIYENKKGRHFFVHRFIFETFKGKIPIDKQVDHIDNCKENNSINNLQLLSPKENSQKSNCKKVKSYNIETFEEKIFESVTEAAKFYQICISTVSAICRKKRKTSKSKKDGKRYHFFYL